MLFDRSQFREAVFSRDSYKCIECGGPAKDAHHIIERRLFPDGGYYIDNGVSLCAKCHILAEQTILSCSHLRDLAGIKKVILPPHLYRDQDYDKWGNPILPNGTRLKGELFEDESVQKALSPVLHLFTNCVKYPRTYHLPWSPGVGKDDRVLASMSQFENKEVIVTEKMDGENTTFYSDYIHARSISYSPHPSRDRVKALHAQIAYDIPRGWRVCGENLFAKHSIRYNKLSSYFLMFSIWNEKNICLSWADTEEWSKLLGLSLVPVLYRGVYDQQNIHNSWERNLDSTVSEGYVLRIWGEFHHSKFSSYVCKYVRKGHVCEDNHWIHRPIEPNGVAEQK